MAVAKPENVRGMLEKLLNMTATAMSRRKTAEGVVFVPEQSEKDTSQTQLEKNLVCILKDMIAIEGKKCIHMCLSILRYNHIFQESKVIYLIILINSFLSNYYVYLIHVPQFKIEIIMVYSHFSLISKIAIKQNKNINSQKIKPAKIKCIEFNTETERNSELSGECGHNDVKDKIRDFAKLEEIESKLDNVVQIHECEIKAEKGNDFKELKNADCLKDSPSQQTENLCNLGGNILDHHGIKMRLQPWSVYIQDTVTYNAQNLTDVRGIPWAWLREEKWRLQTFAKYPLNAKKSAILLAEAGFAYIGSGKDSDDTVICFNCRIIKQNWEEDEDIKESHQAMCPTCAMVIGTGGGNIPLTAPENVSFGRMQQTANQNVIDVDCPQPRSQQLNAPQGASNKPSASVQLATQSVMSPPPPRPQLTQPPMAENRTDLGQASDEGSYRVVTSSNNVPSLSEAEDGVGQSLGSRQPEPATSPQPQRQAAVADPGQTNTTGRDSARTVSDGGNRPPRETTSPASPTLPTVQSARPPSPQPPSSSSSSSQQTASSSTVTATSQSSVPTSVTQSSNAEPASATQSSASSSAAQSSAGTTATQPPATQSSTQPPAPTNQSSTPAPNAPAVPQNPTYLELGIITERPKRYEYAVRGKRLETFGDWPNDHHLCKEDLADAGYYYAGYGDCARCFYCGGGLRNWEQDDDVWVEHARWFPKCAFIRQRLGQAFIDTVANLAQTKDKISFMEVVAEMKIDPSAFQIDSKETPLKNDAAVLAVKQMGFKEKDILPMAASLKETGQILSADILFTALEDLGLDRSKMSPDLAENSPSMSVNRDKAKDEELLHSLKQTNNDLRLQTLCKICMDKEVAVVFLPCGHLVCCTECAAAMKDCPVCRNQVKGVVRAFMG